MASVTLSSPGIVDVAALQAAPIIGTRNITSGLKTTTSTSVFPITFISRFALVAFLALIPEIKVQKTAPRTIPLPVLTLSLTSFPRP